MKYFNTASVFSFSWSVCWIPLKIRLYFIEWGFSSRNFLLAHNFRLPSRN
jgi:hypothetical protein